MVTSTRIAKWMVLLSASCVWHQADVRSEVRSAAQVAWTPVVLTDARTHLASLTPETRVEQLRDFALLAAYVQAEEPAERANGLVTFQPLRLDFLGDLAGHRAGASRWMTLHRGGLLVVVPEASKDAAARLVTIGRAADEYRTLHGTQPARTRAFFYRIDAAAAPPRLEVAPINEITSERLFTADAGYREAQVQTPAQLDAFLAANLDLVFFQVEGASIPVGGRAHASGVPRLITTRAARRPELRARAAERDECGEGGRIQQGRPRTRRDDRSRHRRHQCGRGATERPVDPQCFSGADQLDTGEV